MKKILLTILATTVVAAGVFAATKSTAAVETESDAPLPRARMFTGEIARRLDLTEAQRTSIKELIRLHQPEIRPLLAQARTERAELRAIVTAPTLDEAALAEQSEKMAATHKQILVSTAHLRADLRKLLSPEQLAKVETWRARVHERVGQKREMLRDLLSEP